MTPERLTELKSYCDNEAGNNKECADIYIDLYTLLHDVEELRAQGYSIGSPTFKPGHWGGLGDK